MKIDYALPRDLACGVLREDAVYDLPMDCLRLLCAEGMSDINLL